MRVILLLSSFFLEILGKVDIEWKPSRYRGKPIKIAMKAINHFINGGLPENQKV